MAHSHAPDTGSVSDQALGWAVGLNLGLTGFEVVAGAIAGSVALLADALHNFNDCAALLIALVARRIARRGANERFTFSYRRAELIGAMINLTALLLVGAYLVYEAVHRLIVPSQPDGRWIIAAAGVALGVDVLTAWLLWALSKGSLNLRAAFVHNLTDALASLAVLAGGAAVYRFGWWAIDPLLTLVIAGYLLYLSFGMLRRTAVILMEGTPPDLSLREVADAMVAVDGVCDAHHLHVWELDEHHRALEAHVAVQRDRLGEIETIKRRLRECLAGRFQIEHATLEFEVEQEGCRGDRRRLVPEHP